MMTCLMLAWTTMAFVPPVFPFDDTPRPTHTRTRTPTRTATTAPTPSLATCPGDQNRDRKVTIDEIIRAIHSSLNGCPVR
jgi:hypothetical protein